MILRLNKIQYPVYNLGPGKRMGIWVQGCSIRCKGCINRSTWPKNKGKKIHVLDLFNVIDTVCKNYDGITITGGEPFDQYTELMVFSLLVKRKTHLNILCYTGYYLEELEHKFPDKAFFKCFDYLIDGRYNKIVPSSNSLKGSDNQNIYEFTDQRPLKTSIVNNKKTWSLACEENTIYMAGIPAENDLDEFKDKMLSQGIKIKIV